MTPLTHYTLPGNIFCSQSELNLIIVHKFWVAYSQFSKIHILMATNLPEVWGALFKPGDRLGHQDQDLKIYYWFEAPALHGVKACLAEWEHGV